MFMTIDTWILDTVISCASIIVPQTLLYYGHYHYFTYCNTVTLSLFWHVFIPTLHWCSRTRDTIIARGYIFYWTLLLHSCEHMTRILYCSDIVIIIICYCYMDSPVCKRWLSLYVCCFMLYGLLLHGYSCIPIIRYMTVFQYWYWYILLLDMLAIDTRCMVGAISYIPHLLFPVSRCLV